MKSLILSVLVVCASAQYYPGYVRNYGYGFNYNPYAYSFPSASYAPYAASQYHAQDEIGQASYGYSYPGAASSTTRDAFGNQIGSYAYINAEGKEVRVSYVADANGFRVLSNDLPQAPVDNLVAPVFTGEAPAPVEDTAEVAAAKAEFFKLYEEAAAAAAAAPESRKKRSLFAYPYAVPAVAKTTVKTAYYEPNEAALTPAATTKIDLKEKEHEVITPLAYPAPVAFTAAHIAPVTTKFISAPVVQAPVAPYFVTRALPAVAKTTIKTAYYEPNEAALTPAATTKIDLKEKEHEVITPLAYSLPVGYAAPHFGYQVVV